MKWYYYAKRKRLAIRLSVAFSAFIVVLIVIVVSSKKPEISSEVKTITSTPTKIAEIASPKSSPVSKPTPIDVVVLVTPTILVVDQVAISSSPIPTQTVSPTPSKGASPIPSVKPSSSPAPTKLAVNSPVVPTKSPTPKLVLTYKTEERHSSTKAIYPIFRLLNSGVTTVNLSNVKLRYYYTSDGEVKQNSWCDFCTVGASNVTTQIIKSSSRSNSDHYLEIGFTSSAGTLAPTENIELQIGLVKNDWTQFNQTNDYSFNSSASNFLDNSKIDLIIK